ncbi:MAG: hypothetical protein ACJ763_15375 [Bdellovibrionia bacterium]
MSRTDYPVLEEEQAYWNEKQFVKVFPIHNVRVMQDRGMDGASEYVTVVR